MDKSRVLDALRTLQAELAGADLDDDQSRAALQQVAADIEQKPSRDEPLEDEAGQSLPERLQDALLEFEAEHPRLTGAMNQVAAALANLGI